MRIDFTNQDFEYALKQFSFFGYDIESEPDTHFIDDNGFTKIVFAQSNSTVTLTLTLVKSAIDAKLICEVEYFDKNNEPKIFNKTYYLEDFDGNWDDLNDEVEDWLSESKQIANVNDRTREISSQEKNMEYKGIELKEFTSDKPVAFEWPKKMLVWDDDDTSPDECDVYAFIPGRTPVVTDDCAYEHCAEIPEKPKPRRATNRELAKWLANGNGEYRGDETARAHYAYNWGSEGYPVSHVVEVRKWDDTEWHEPTVDYMFGEEMDDA